MDSHGCYHAALRSQKAVTAHFKGEQLLPFGFARQPARLQSRHLSDYVFARQLSPAFACVDSGNFKQLF